MPTAALRTANTRRRWWVAERALRRDDTSYRRTDARASRSLAMDSVIFERPCSGGGKAAAITMLRRLGIALASLSLRCCFMAPGQRFESGLLALQQAILTVFCCRANQQRERTPRQALAARGRRVCAALLAWATLLHPLLAQEQPVVPKMVFAH